MADLADEVIEQLRCAVTPGCEAASGELAGLCSRFGSEFEARKGPAAIGPVVFWQALYALLFELAEKAGPYEAAHTISGAVYYRFADLGTATFGPANPNVDLDDDDPIVVELYLFDEAIRRAAADEDPDDVYVAMFG